MRGGWKNGQHESWLPSFENHVFPIIGRTPIDQVDSNAVLKVLEPIWLTIGPTAKRILQRIGTVLDYAHIKKLIPDEVSLRSVTRGLPRQVDRPWIPQKHIGPLLPKWREYVEHNRNVEVGWI